MRSRRVKEGHFRLIAGDFADAAAASRGAAPPASDGFSRDFPMGFGFARPSCLVAADLSFCSLRADSLAG